MSKGLQDKIIEFRKSILGMLNGTYLCGILKMIISGSDMDSGVVVELKKLTLSVGAPSILVRPCNKT